MDNTWFITAGLTVIYIIILVVYFLRRSKSHEKELTEFLSTAKNQLEEHKSKASQEANVKVIKAMTVVQKVQEAAQVFEQQAQEEYEQIIKDAKEERRELLMTAKQEIEDLFAQAEEELKGYREERQREIEKDLVKLVVSVAEKVTEVSFSKNQHNELIYKALDEIKSRKSRS